MEAGVDGGVQAVASGLAMKAPTTATGDSSGRRIRPASSVAVMSASSSANAIPATSSKAPSSCRGSDNGELYPDLPRCCWNQSRAAPLAASKSLT